MADSAAAKATLDPTSSDRWWFEFALIVLVCFIAGGAPAPHVNETHYLTKAKHYWDPAYCPGDLFLDSTDAHLTFYWTVGWLTKWLSLSAVAWIGRLVAWLLLALGWLRLARSITCIPWAAALSALAWLVLVDACDFAGEWVVGGIRGKGGVESKCFAYPLVLFGLASISAGRWRTCWLWFGAASAFHPLVGGWAVVAGLGAWIGEPRTSRPRALKLLPGLAAGAILALPGLLPALALDRGATPEEAAEAARIYVFERLPHHLAPLGQPASDLAARSVRFGVVVTALAALAVWLARAGDARPGEWRPDALRRVMRFALVALVGNCIGLSINLFLAGAPLRAAALLRYYWFRQADTILPAAVALALVCVAIELRRHAPRAAQLATAVVVLACAAHLMRITAERWRTPFPPGIARMHDPVAWVAACEWIRGHAPPRAVCLIPRHAQSFNWYASRADVVNWKDIPQDAKSVIQWFARIEDVFPAVGIEGETYILSSPEQWGAVRALQVAHKYGADYIVARSEPPLGLREVFAATSDPLRPGYSVYAVDDADDSHADPTPREAATP